jgi:hypothetical protein
MSGNKKKDPILPKSVKTEAVMTEYDRTSFTPYDF